MKQQQYNNNNIKNKKTYTYIVKGIFIYNLKFMYYVRKKINDLFEVLYLN
jgi:hypothetical protein